MPTYKDIDQRFIELAMQWADLLGTEQIRAYFGFKKAARLAMYRQGLGPYESRPLVAAAFHLQFPEAKKLDGQSLKGSAASDLLKHNFGFTSK